MLLNKLKYIKWRETYFELFMNRWELKDHPERGNWSNEELYQKWLIECRDQKINLILNE